MAQTPTDPTKAQVWITKGIDDLDFEFYFPNGPKGDPGGITLGTNLGTNNLNDYITSGMYRQGVTADATLLRNYPMDQQSGTMLVIERVTGNTVTQIFYPIYIPSLKFIRMYNNGTWSTWRSFGATRVDQTAGRAMYHWDAVNNREQLIYGDTGFRDIAADQAWNDALFNGTTVVKNSANLARLRRAGNTVELHFAFDRNISNTISMASAFPLGFRPFSPLVALGSNSGMVLCRLYHAGAASGLTYNNQTAVATAASVNLVFTTNDPWPTSLPGTAVGTIPNT